MKARFIAQMTAARNVRILVGDPQALINRLSSIMKLEVTVELFRAISESTSSTTVFGMQAKKDEQLLGVIPIESGLCSIISEDDRSALDTLSWPAFYLSSTHKDKREPFAWIGRVPGKSISVYCASNSLRLEPSDTEDASDDNETSSDGETEK